MSTTFALTPQALINAVLRLQGWLDYTATPDGTKSANMLEALNIMVKAWQSEGLKLWTIEEFVLTAPTFAAGKTSYTIGPTGADITTDRPLRFEHMLLRNLNGATDQEVYPVSRKEYLLLGNKSDAGTPSQYFYNPLTPNGVISLYNTPDASTIANYEIHMYVRRNLSDVNTLSDTFEFPSEWYQALKWNLAQETSLENQCPTQVIAQIDKWAPIYKSKLEDWDREWVDVTFGIDTQYTGQLY